MIKSAINAENKIKILIVDDDELIRLTLRNNLKKHGFTVIEAANGHEATDRFRDETPSLVLIDLLMPEKEGLETIVDIRSINPHVKIIAMTGGGNTQNMTFLSLAQKVGANSIMSKPIKPDDLFKTIDSLLSI